MKEILLVTGGCRSGKSRFALEYANKHFQRKIFLATAEALDDEMKERIKVHKEGRGPGWTTVEEPVHLVKALAALNAYYDVVLIDCLTLWINNLLLLRKNDKEIMIEVDGLIESMQKIPQSLIIVTNEVGYGIVPENKIARQFRDIAGRVNQRVAEGADVVTVTIAGLPLVLRGELR